MNTNRVITIIPKSSVLVIDLEATCSDDESLDGSSMEIIEIGAVWVAVNGAPTFDQVAPLLNKFTLKHAQCDSIWANWGNYDRVQFEHHSIRHRVENPGAHLPHANVKKLFAKNELLHPNKFGWSFKWQLSYHRLVPSLNVS